MFTSAQFAIWLSAAWKHAEGAFPVAGVSHDTRTIRPGEVFIALRGPNFDGHDFVAQAVEKGAAGIIAEREFPEGCIPQMIVPGTMDALRELARGCRATWLGTVIGITGSAGKTTVKEMVASILAQQGTVSKTLGNWNNGIGLPLSMLAADPASDYFVFELGMNHPGEIDALAALLKPDWALITSVGKAHMEFFRSVEQIADEKAAILKHAGAALLDVRSEWAGRFLGRCPARVELFGDEPLDFRVDQPGAHMAANAQMAGALGLQLGLSPRQIQAGLDAFEPAPMRWERIERGGIVLINDAYNANPLSMRAAISAFAGLAGAERKFLVLGGMRELGADSDAEHRALGAFIAPFQFDGVVTIGDTGAKIACDGVRHMDKPAAAGFLREMLRSGDMVLLKGSRGERLETVLEEFEKENGDGR